MPNYRVFDPRNERWIAHVVQDLAKNWAIVVEDVYGMTSDKRESKLFSSPSEADMRGIVKNFSEYYGEVFVPVEEG